MTDEERVRESNRLWTLGYDLLSQRRFRETLRLAIQLEKLGNSGAYDLRARAYSAMGRPRQAVKTLRIGLRRYPSVALLWSLMGELLSDQGDWDGALRAFERSAEGVGGHRALADYNTALVCLRMGDSKRGLQKIALIPAETDKPPVWAIHFLSANL